MRLVAVAVVVLASCRGEPPEPADQTVAGVCPLEGHLAIRDASEPFRQGALLISNGDGRVRSALAGVIERVHLVEEGPTGNAEITVRSGDLTLTYGRGSGPSFPHPGQEIGIGEDLGLRTDLLWVGASRAGESIDARALLGEWGCLDSLPPVQELRVRFLDGSEWKVILGKPLVVAGAESVGVYGNLEVDGKGVADVSRSPERPDLTHAQFGGQNPPELIETFHRQDGRQAQLWNESPNPGDSAYLLWIEGPGQYIYVTSAIPPEEAESIATSLRFEEGDGNADAIWFASDRLAITALQTVFFLTDPDSPLTDNQVVLNSQCEVVDPAREGRCTRVWLNVPIGTGPVKAALQEVTIERVGCAETETIRPFSSEGGAGEDALAEAVARGCGEP
jgi:hypothetical protein